MTDTIPTSVPPSPAADASPQRRFPPLLGGVLGIGLVVAVHLVLSGPMRVPIIQPDELGYLQNARYLARGGLRSQVEYYPGFSVLLIPAWLLSAAPLTVFRSALWIEAGLSGLSAWLVWQLVPRLVGPVQPGYRALIAGLVCAYPAALLYGDFALSEMAFGAMFVLVVLVAAWALPDHRIRAWATFGLTSGLLVLVHPRGLAVVVAAVVIGLAILGWRRAGVGPLLALTAGFVTSLSITVWLVRQVKTPTTQLGAYQPDGVISKSLSIHGATALGTEVFGQLFYLSVATFGLLPLGLILGARSLWRVLWGSDRQPIVLVQAFAALSFVGVWGLSSLFANLGDRADKLIYGRYNEGAIAPLLVLALADLLLSTRGKRRIAAACRWLAVGTIAIGVSGLVVMAGDSQAELYGPLNPANILSLQPVLARTGEHIHIIVLGAIGLAVLLILSLISWRLPVVAFVALALIFAASTIDTETGYIIPGSRARAQQDVIAQAIDSIRAANIGDLSCISYDPAPLGYGDYTYYEDQFLSPTQQFATFDTATGTPLCGTLAISRADPTVFASHYPGARLITSENFVDQSLWAVPRLGDDTFAALEVGGWLSPGPSASLPLPPDALAGGSITVSGKSHVEVVRGQTSRVVVTIHHGAGGAPWPAVGALHSGSGEYGVRLTVQWYTMSSVPGPVVGEGPTLARGATVGTGSNGFPTTCLSLPDAPIGFSCSRIELPATLLPGQSDRMSIDLTAGAALPPGAYRVEVGLEQEGVGSFSTQLDLQVTVV